MTSTPTQHDLLNQLSDLKAQKFKACQEDINAVLLKYKCALVPSVTICDGEVRAFINIKDDAPP